MVLLDESNAYRVVLNHVFESDIRATGAAQTFEVKGRPLQMTHVLLAAGRGVRHQVHFCANRRVVRTEPLERHVPNLPSSFLHPTDERLCVYAGFVAGDYLDETVSPDRSDFEMASHRDEAITPDAVAWPDVLDGSVQEVRGYLTPFTEPLRKEKEEQIRIFVRTKAPLYRPLIKHRPGALDAIEANLPEDRLDLELYKQQQRYEADLRQQAREIQSTIEKGEALSTLDDYHQHVAKLIEEWNDLGMAQLARYVAHRRGTLEFLAARLRVNPEGKYALEKAIHEIIFPLRSTSDDVSPGAGNLWIIDERLSYHYYLSSDNPFTEVEPIENDSKDRADLLIFDNPSAFVEGDTPFGAIVLVEFKRPVRKDYHEEANPVKQVYRYVRDIRAGRAIDGQGRPIVIGQNTRFYAYVVCDLMPKVREQIEDASFRAMSDNQGYFNFNPENQVYVEVISYQKLVGDAQRRNRILFDKLENAIPS